MYFRATRSFARAWLLVLPLVSAACETTTGPHPSAVASPLFAAIKPIPAEGTDTTLDFGTWNLEWFGHPDNGPADEALQRENVRDLIKGTDLDLWGLQEVTHASQFQSLMTELPSYKGLLANDASVTDGPAYYSDFSDTEMKVGIIYKTAVASVQSARLILTANNDDFAGRPPLEVKMSVTLNGTTENLVVIVLHAKAGTSATDWDRRKRGADALKNYLDTTYPTQKVIVIGDFNDDVDTSISSGRASPYAAFVSDSADYRFPTKTLSDAGVSSTVNYDDMVDHHLTVNEVYDGYVFASAKVFPAQDYFSNYGTTTSDHYPVLSRYTNTGAGNDPPPASITLSVNGYKVKGVQHADLGWSGATTSTVDVYRNGAVITTTANDGAHTDNIGTKGSGSYVYKVCEAGSAICSPEKNVVF